MSPTLCHKAEDWEASTAAVLRSHVRDARLKVVASCATGRHHLKAVDPAVRHLLTGGRLKRGCGLFVTPLMLLRMVSKRLAKKNSYLRRESSPIIRNRLPKKRKKKTGHDGVRAPQISDENDVIGMLTAIMTETKTEIVTALGTAEKGVIEIPIGGRRAETPRTKTSLCPVVTSRHGSDSASLRKSRGPRGV